MQHLIDFIISNGVIALVMALALLGATAYVTLLERKFIGWVQIRQGPNVVGPYGLLQPIADAVKAMNKEVLIPYRSDALLYLLSPYLLFSLMLASWMVMPISSTIVAAPVNIGLLLILAFSSFSVYSVVFAGWASNSVYAVMGSLRSVAQMISYELSMGFCAISVALVSGSMDLHKIVADQEYMWNIIPMLPVAIIFFISALAETNRVPFDVAEGESEIVGGYSVEYSGFPFALFFFGEYLGLLLISALFSALFLGGWHFPFLNGMPVLIFIAKTSFIVIIFLWIRATLPRMRYDHIMMLGWKVLLPFAMLCFYITAFCVIYNLS